MCEFCPVTGECSVCKAHADEMVCKAIGVPVADAERTVTVAHALALGIPLMQVVNFRAN